MISVVMPVFNAGPYLDECIQSIVNQTFTDFEFVILDDMSTDGSDRVLREWKRKDRRIQLFQSDQRLGLARSSNAVVHQANAAIIARMDADDVAHPNRLRRQVEIIECHPDIVAVGTLCDGIDAQGHLVRPRDRWRLLSRSSYVPFPHGSVMFRRQAFDTCGGYREDLTLGEDRDFFTRMTAVGRVVTIPDVLYHYRYHSSNATLLHAERAFQATGELHSQNGHNLAELYMLGAMRLWSGRSPRILAEILSNDLLRWNLGTLAALTSTAWGSISSSSLRFFLRQMIRFRDLIASLRVSDGKFYEWHIENRHK